MKCGVCGEERPDTDPYCGNCGALLNAEAGKLRQQILAVVRETVKDGDVLANEIATTIEDRLWRWGKILIIAGSVALGAFAVFGIRTISSAKKQIDNAAAGAAQDIQQAGVRNATALNQQGLMLRAQLEKDAGPTEAELKGLSSRSKTDTVQVERLEAAYRNFNERMAKLQQIEQYEPQTPIGNSLVGGLISPTGSGLLGVGAVPPGLLGAGGTPGLLSTPNWLGASSTGNVLITGTVYRKGSSGPEIEYLNKQLSALGCYSGVGSNQFDDTTVAAVKAFQDAYRRGQSSLPVSLSTIASSSVLDYHNLTASLYTPLGTEQQDGEVGWTTWNHLFETSPVHCK